MDGGWRVLVGAPGHGEYNTPENIIQHNRYPERVRARPFNLRQLWSIYSGCGRALVITHALLCANVIQHSPN